jgi:hypothetical protein
VIAALAPSALGCYSYSAIPLTEVDTSRAQGRNMRFTMFSGVQISMLVTRVDYPFVEGSVEVNRAAGNFGFGNESKSETTRLDLREVVKVEIQELDSGATVGYTFLALTGTALAVVIIVALTKSSCPFVYIDRGHGYELVGEAYAGAAFRSIQRDDLLPIPDFPDSTSVKMRLFNGAHETQYTDRLEVWTVDHAPGVRVVSTQAAELLAVSESIAPTEARDFDGRDATHLVSTADGNLWQSDLTVPAESETARLTEGMTATFAPLKSGDTPVLEITGGNTAWLDLVFGRFFAAMGDNLERYLEKGNDPKASSRIRAWRAREGVDLKVEVLEGGSWKEVALVPTIGPMSLRRVAVRLPAVEKVQGGSLQVRLTGGLGFWKVDKLALSTVEQGAKLEVKRSSPVLARGLGGADERSALGDVDGRYQVLPQFGDAMQLSFNLPAHPADQTRDAFLFSNGYYNVHRPPESSYRPGTLLAIRDDPGALARFGLDLYRGYVQRLQQTASSVERPHP